MDIKEVRGIVRALTLAEKKELKRRYKANGQNGSESLSLRLFDCLSNDLIDNNELQTALYGRQNKVAFDKLVNRLIDRIADVILLKDNIEDATVYDLRSQDIFNLKRELLISELYRFRGFNKTSLNKIDKVIQKSTYYEHYDILLSALEMKRRWYFFEISKTELSRYDKEIAKINEFRIFQREAWEVFLNVARHKPESSLVTYLQFLKDNIKKFQKYYLLSNSKSIRFYNYFIEMQLMNLSKDFNKAIVVGEEILEFIQNNKNIYSRIRHGNILMNLSLFNRYLFRFENSIQYLNEAKKYYFNQEYSNMVYYEQIFLTYFYLGNDSKIRYYHAFIEEESESENIPKQDSNRLIYYSSVYSFIYKDYRSCASKIKLIDTSAISIEFNIELKVLMILTSIEMEKFDLAESMIDNLTKYNSRLKTFVRAPLKDLIIKLLQRLARGSFNFSKVLQDNEVLFNELSNLYKKFSFNQFHLIIFYEWFSAKEKKVQYDHAEIMKQLKVKNRNQ
jgi:hypothetical protein